jgi:uncharacterized RDD family membrane protein YckC
MTEQEVPPMEQPPAPHPESISHPPSTTSEFAPSVSRMIADPWPRFFARMVDLQLWGLLLAFMAALLLPWLFEDRAFLTSQLGSRFFGWILIPFALGLDAVVYTLLGNTPGKWIAGIKVKSLAGDKVSFPTYLKRNCSLYWFGLGLDIPIVVLVTMWSNYGHAEGNETVRWDESTGTRPFIRVASTIRVMTIGAIWFLLYAWQLVEFIHP